MMTGFEAYKLYVALKNHFNRDSYDFFKYNGKTTASVAKFDQRNDRYFFIKLAKQKDCQRFILANILSKGPNVWIGDLVNDQQSDATYRQWLKHTESLTYEYTNELSLLDDDFNSNFTVNKNNHPTLLKLFIRRQISIETLVIINDLCGFIRLWDKKMADDPIWLTLSRTIKKYKPFLTYDREKFKNITVDKFTSIA